MENTSVKPGKFIVPQNYQEEEIGDNAEPWLEDLEDEDVEIWIMQAPPNVDLSMIQGMQMKLSGKTRFDCAGSLGDKLETTVIPSENSRLHCSLIAPSKKDKKFHLVKKPFSGHILMTESFEIPLCSAPEETNIDRLDYPERLKQKHQFGSYFATNAKPLSSPKKKRKSNKEKSHKAEKIVFSSSDADDVIEQHLVPENNNIGTKKKEKKLRPHDKNFEELNNSSSTAVENLSETNFTINDSISEQDASISEKEKHKKKKKKKDLSLPVLEVKQEPLDVFESSDFATPNHSICEGDLIRKKKKKKSRQAEELSTESENERSLLFSSAVNKEVHKPKDKLPKVKQEPMSPVLNRFSYSQEDDDVNTFSKRRKKKDRNAYGYDEDASLEELERNNMSERYPNKHDCVFDVSTDPDDSAVRGRKKTKKNKVKVKEEKISPDRSGSLDSSKNNHDEDESHVIIKQEKYDPIFENSFSQASFESTSKSKKKKSKENRHSEISYSDVESEEVKPDIGSIPIVMAQGKEFKLDRNFLKAAKAKKKEKRRKSEAFE